MFDRFGRAREQYTAQYHIIAPTAFLGGLFLALGGALLLGDYSSRTLDITPIAHAQTTVSGTQQCPLKNDLYLNPFNKDSAHHRPIGTGAQYAGDSHLATQSWKRARAFIINVGAPWGVSTAVTTASDPEYTLTAKASCDKPSQVPVTVRLPRGGFDTRVVKNENGCADGVVVVYDRSTQKPHQLRQYDWNNGKPTAGQYRTWDIKGLGHGTKMGDRIGTSASGVAALFGVLRGEEINTPGRPIRHALQLVLPRKPTDTCEMLISRDIILPAVSADGSAFTGNNNRGTIPYGGLLAIPPESKGGPNLDSLGLSEAGKRLAEAVRDYGVYVVDGGNCPSIRADQHIKNVPQIKSDIAKFYKYMRLVTNSAWTPGGAPAGGGTPIAPNCAFDAPDDGQVISTPIAGDNGTGGGATGGGTSGGTSGGGTTGGGSGSGGGTSQTALCHILGPNTSPPAGYGAPYNMFSANRNMLIEGWCRDQEVEVIVGDERPDTYVYKLSYYWNGSEWTPVELVGTQPVGSWFVGTAETHFNRLGSRMWYVAYTCHRTDGSWKCGCSNQACRESRWQVQGFMTQFASIPGVQGGSGGATTGGSSGGATGGGTSGGGPSGGGVNDRTTYPRVFNTPAEIQTIKQKVAQGQQPWKAAYDKLMGVANAALNQSVTPVTAAGPSCGRISAQFGGGTVCGDQHDFITDNPAVSSPNRSDYANMSTMAEKTYSLAVAYALTGDSRYSQKAIDNMKRWFLDPSTYAHYRFKGGWTFMEKQLNINAMALAVDMLASDNAAQQNYKNWMGQTESIQAGMCRWMEGFVESNAGRPDGLANYKPSGQNYDQWKWSNVAIVGSACDRPDFINWVVTDWKTRLPEYVDNTGDFFHEQRGDMSFEYSTYALKAMVLGALAIENYNGTNLWTYEKNGSSLEKALDYHAPWMTKSVVGFNPGENNAISKDYDNVDLYEIAYMRLGKASYLRALTNTHMGYQSGTGRPKFDTFVLHWSPSLLFAR